LGQRTEGEEAILNLQGWGSATLFSMLISNVVFYHFKSQCFLFFADLSAFPSLLSALFRFLLLFCLVCSVDQSLIHAFSLLWPHCPVCPTSQVVDHSSSVGALSSRV
jgi:hypothetical protein